MAVSHNAITSLYSTLCLSRCYLYVPLYITIIAITVPCVRKLAHISALDTYKRELVMELPLQTHVNIFIIILFMMVKFSLGEN